MLAKWASIGPALARAEQALDQTVAEPLPDSAYTEGTAVGVDLGGDDHPSAERRQKQQVVRARAVKTLAVVRQARGIWTQDGDLETIKGNSNNAWGNKIIEKAKTDPALLVYKIQANSYKFSWALIPLSVPFVWLLFFWRRDVGLYDHTVFVTYSMATMTLLTAILVVLSRLGLRDTWLLSTLMLLAPIHIFVHLRGSYALTKRAMLIRFLFLSLFIWLAAALFAIILLALGALS